MPSPSLGALTKTGLGHRIVVGISDSAVSNNPGVTLITHSLGSCIGVTAYDPEIKVGGLLHYMLPDGNIDPIKSKALPSMFGNTGIPALIHSVCEMKGEKSRLIVTISGGAQIMDTGNYFNIGRRNYEMAKNLFEKNSYKVFAEHVGGIFSRTVSLNLGTGEVCLKISGKSEDIMLCKPQ